MDKLFCGENFVYFFGTVEDSYDPLSLGRVRVRIVAHHSSDQNDIPVNALPYASVILPTTSANIGGVGTSFTIPVGTRVWGFFLDGGTRLQPVVAGVLSGEHRTTLTNSIPPNNAIQQPNVSPLLGVDNSHVEQSCPSGDLATNNSANIVKPDYRTLDIGKGNFVYPCNGYISDYYLSRNGRHFGVDIATTNPQTSTGSPHLAGRFRGGTGSPIYSIADGVVKYIFKHSQGQKQAPTNYDLTGQGSRSYGNAIGIQHNINGVLYLSIYAHLGLNQDASLDSDNSGVLVTKGQTVTKGEQIGNMGRTHNFDTPTHLHLEIRQGGTLEGHGLNSIPPWSIFPKMQNVDHSILSWVNSTMNYKNLPPWADKDLPMQALQSASETTS